MTIRKITCIVRDNASGYSDPLVYCVRVHDPVSQQETRAAVMRERMADTGCDESELDLDVLFAFVGEPKIIADWRE